MQSGPDFSRFSEISEIHAHLKAKSIRGAVFVASAGAADFVLRFASIAIFARLLRPEDFGLIAMVAAVTVAVDSVRDLGLSAATVQRPAITHAQVSNLFWLNASFGAMLALGFSVFAPWIAGFYGDDRLTGITLGLSFVFLWSGMGVQHEALMSRQLRQGEIALIRLLANVGSTVIAIVLAIDGWGYWALVWREVLRSVMITGGVWLRCKWCPGLPKRNVETGSFIRFGGELSAANILGGMITNVDKLLVGRLFGAVPAGLYRQAQLIVFAPLDQLQAPFNAVAQPALSRLRADPARYRRYFERIAFITALTTIPIGLCAVVYPRELTLLLLGSKWEDATRFVQIFGFAAMIRPTIGTTACVLITCGFSTRFLALNALHSIVLFLLLLIGAGVGPAGIAMAHVGTTILLMLPKLHYSFVGTPVTMTGFFNAIRPPFVAGIAMAVSMVGFKHWVDLDRPIGVLFAGVLLGGLAYVLTILLQPVSRGELTSLWTDVRRAMRRTWKSDDVLPPDHL
jgi:O-antigen/teichoic acid export membrane protein